MKLKIIYMLMICLTLCCLNKTDYKPTNGDIIFHTSRSAQSLAIQKATHSKYSHMGIVYIKDGQPFVFEAVEPVKLTPFHKWVSRGKNGEYAVKRLKGGLGHLTPKQIKRMQDEGKAFEGKHYDLYFEWSDDRIYCSELVWKIYERALGIELGEPQTFTDFDFSDPVVKSKLKERFGYNFPQKEKVISPSAIFESEKLVVVYEKKGS